MGVSGSYRELMGVSGRYLRLVEYGRETHCSLSVTSKRSVR
jgi:hypothetical protein